MERRTESADEMRAKKMGRARNKKGQKGSAKGAAERALAMGTQSLGDINDPGFQPWLRDDEYDPHIKVGRKEQRTPPEGQRTMQGRGVEAASQELERREAHVRELQKLVASGDYAVDSIALARAMLGFNRSENDETTPAH
jgi:anti-sigma28 factor (negative regulator of flagellin synthesis)